MCSFFHLGADDKKLLGVKDCAEYLGISVNTLYGWVHQKSIPYIKVGHLVKFRVKNIDSWLTENSVKPFEFKKV